MKESRRAPRLAASSNLTENQLLFWISYKLQPDVPIETHSIRFAFTLEAIDPDHFLRAVQKLFDHADSLRTVVREAGVVPMRHVEEPRPVRTDIIRVGATADPGAAARDWIAARRRMPLDPGAPFESTVLELAPQRFVWYLALHHMISDGRTVSLIVDNVSRYYALSLEGKLDTAAPLPAFEDYVDHDRSYRVSEAHRSAAAYWTAKLADCRRASARGVAMMTNRALPAQELLQTDQLSVELGPERSAALLACARREGLFSPAVAVLTTLFLTVAQLRGVERSLVIGTTFLNRPERFRATIGLFVTTCPLLIDVDRADSALSLARKVQVELIRSSKHENYPIQNPTHDRIYDVFFNYLNVQFPSFAGRPLRAERIRSGISNNALSLTLRDFGATGNLSLDFEFQRHAFSPERQRYVVAHVLQLLDAFASNPHQMPVISDEARLHDSG